MDSIRVSKVRLTAKYIQYFSDKFVQVERVTCTKSGSTLTGTIHLTAHHLIFQYDEDKESELWVRYYSAVIDCVLTISQVPYPLISLVTRLPQTIQGQCPLSFNSRTFETFTVSFARESDATDVFDSVKELTVASASNLLLSTWLPC